MIFLSKEKIIFFRLPDGSNKLLFPRDPPLAEISERILSSLPFLPLRNGDSTTYSRAACNLIGDALKLNGIQLSHDGTAVVSTERSNETENQNICEVWIFSKLVFLANYHTA